MMHTKINIENCDQTAESTNRKKAMAKFADKSASSYLSDGGQNSTALICDLFFPENCVFHHFACISRFNATLTAKVISWLSVMHMCFLAFLHQY